MIRHSETLPASHAFSYRCSTCLFQFEQNEVFVSRVTSNARRYANLFSEAIDSLLPKPSEDFPLGEEDVYDVLQQNRAQQHQAQGGGADDRDPNYALPPDLCRR